MEKNSSATAIHIMVACVGVVFKKPVVFMDSEQNAQNMDPSPVTEVMVNETQKELFLKIQSGKDATPQASRNRTISHVIQSINLTITQKARCLSFSEPERGEPTMKTST